LARDRGFESLPSSGESRANLKTTSAFRCRVETARNRAMAFRGHLLTRLRAFRHAYRGSGVNHSGLSRRWALAPPQPAEAFSDRRVPVGAGDRSRRVERLSDLDRPDDLALARAAGVSRKR
jgi:hypothetical protein